MKDKAKSTSIAQATAIVFSANLAQMAFGFAVSAIVAAVFGSAAQVDAFFIALPVPLMVGQFTLSLALLALIPHYQRVRSEFSPEEAQRQLAPLFWGAMLISLGLAGAMFFFANEIALILAPGFDQQRLSILATYLRFAILVVPFVVGTNFLQAIENANQLFVRPAFSRPLMGALALGAILIFLNRGDLASYFWGLAIGSALGFFWQLSEVRRLGSFPFGLRGIVSVWRVVRSAVGWMALARGLGQSSEVALQMIASMGIVGTVATYAFGFKIAAIPMMLSVSLAVALFPRQSQASADNDSAKAERVLEKGVGALGLMGALFGSFFFLWADQLVVLLYERGDFTVELTEQVGLTIRIFSLSLIAVAANNAVGNAFWAAGRLKERIVLEAIAITILLVAALTLISDYGPAALALAYGLQFAFLTFAGLWRLSATGGMSRIFVTLGKVTLAGVVTAALLWPLVPEVESFRQYNILWRLLALALGGLGSSLLFFSLVYVLRVAEAREALARFLCLLGFSKSLPAKSPTTTDQKGELERQMSGKRENV